MGRSQFCSFSRYSPSTACVDASDASTFLNSPEVSRFALGRIHSSSRICVDSGTGVRSFLLYLEPHCGLARQKATRTRKLTNSKRLSCWSCGGVSRLRRFSIASRIGSQGSCFFLTPATVAWRSAEPLSASAVCALAVANWRVSSSSLNCLLQSWVSLARVRSSMTPSFVADEIVMVPWIEEPQ